jgi:hypothetical protein
MRPDEVVMLQPGEQGLVAFLGVGPMANVGPLARCGLNEALGLAVGAGCVRPSKAVTDAELRTEATELARAIAASVVVSRLRMRTPC